MKAFKKMALFYRPAPPKGSFEIGEELGFTLEISTLFNTNPSNICSFTNFQLMYYVPNAEGQITVGDFLYQDKEGQIPFSSGGSFSIPMYYLVRVNSSSSHYIAGIVDNQIISLQLCDDFELTTKFDIVNNSANYVINNVSPVFLVNLAGTFPLSFPNTSFNVTSSFIGTSISVNLENITPATASLDLLIDLVTIDTITVLGTGVYSFTPVNLSEGQNLLIQLNNPS